MYYSLPVAVRKSSSLAA